MKCLFCKNLITRRGNTKFCSLECYGKSMIGRISNNKGKKWNEESRLKFKEHKKDFIPKHLHTKKVRQKIKETLKNKWKKIPKECWFCKKVYLVIPARNNRTRFCSIKCNSSYRFSGERHPNWKGGKSFEPYSPSFSKHLKEFIRKRDNYRCQECGKEGCKRRALDIHHIDYNKKNCSEKNLISLCPSCHVKTNFKRLDWERYYKNKIEKIYVKLLNH